MKNISLSTTLNNEIFMLNVFILKISMLFFFLLFHLFLHDFACPLTKQEWHLYTNIHVRQEGLPHAPLWRFALLAFSVAQSCKLQMQHCSLSQMLAQAVEHALEDPRLRSTTPEEKKGDL